MEKRASVDVEVLSQEELDNFASEPGNALFWEQIGLDAITKARGSKEFKYDKYVETKNGATTPKVSALMQDYSEVGSFLAICIIGMVLSFIGSSVMCGCCVLKQPRKLDPDDIKLKRKIFAVVLMSLMGILVVFFTFVSLSSLNDFLSGMRTASLAAGSIFLSSGSMIQSSSLDLSNNFKNLTFNFAPFFLEAQSDISRDLDLIYNDTNVNSTYIDTYLSHAKNNSLLERDMIKKFYDGLLYIESNRIPFTNNLPVHMFACKAVDASQEQPGDDEEGNDYYFRNYKSNFTEYTDTTFTYSDNVVIDNTNLVNGYSIKIPPKLFGEAITFKLNQIKLKRSSAFIAANTSFHKAFNTTKNNLTDLFANEASVSKVDDQTSSFTAANTGYFGNLNLLSSLIYSFFAVFFFALMSVAVGMAIKVPRISMTALCTILVLSIFSFCFAFGYYVLAFIAGDSCLNLSQNISTLKLANAEFAEFAQAGLAAKDLCAQNISVYQLLLNESIKELLPSNFNQSTLNVDTLVKYNIEAQGIDFKDLINEIDSNAYDSRDFTNFEDSINALDLSAYDPLLYMTGSLNETFYPNITFTLKVLADLQNYTFDNFVDSYLEPDLATFNFVKGRINIVLSNLRTTKTRFETMRNHQSFLTNEPVNFPLFKTFASDNMTFIHDLLFNTSDIYEFWQSRSKLKFRSYVSEIKTNVTNLMIKEITKGFVSNNCRAIDVAVDAMTTSVCNRALYF